MLQSGTRSPFELTRAEQERLVARLGEAIDRARRSGTPTLATITRPLAGDVDPTSVVCASRRSGEHWFVFEQPDRDATAVAGLGQATALEASGSARVSSVAERWRALAADAACDRYEANERGGPIAVGGFAFAPDGGAAPHWSGFAPASLVVPEVAISRSARGGSRSVRMTLAALAAPDDLAEDLLARLQQRLSQLREAPLPLLDPAPTGRFQSPARCRPSTTRPPSRERAS